MSNMATHNAEMKVINGVQMMNSRGIAIVAQKDHAKLCRDIRVMLEKLYGISDSQSIRNPDLAYLTNHGVICIQYDSNNPNAWEYWLDYEHSQCLVAGYDALRRMSIIRQWQALKDEVKQLNTPQHSAQQEISMNNDILSLARVVAEATASATMKAVMEVSGINLITATPVAPASPAIAESVTTSATNADLLHSAECDADGYIAVTKLSWVTTFSDPSCRHLIEFAALPTRKTPGIRGLMVHKESFMSALSALIDESEPPAPGRKRWKHSGFGCFALRKDPKEIFGEAE